MSSGIAVRYRGLSHTGARQTCFRVYSDSLIDEVLSNYLGNCCWELSYIFSSLTSWCLQYSCWRCNIYSTSHCYITPSQIFTLPYFIYKAKVTHATNKVAVVADLAATINVVKWQYSAAITATVTTILAQIHVPLLWVLLRLAPVLTLQLWQLQCCCVATATTNFVPMTTVTNTPPSSAVVTTATAKQPNCRVN